MTGKRSASRDAFVSDAGIPVLGKRVGQLEMLGFFGGVMGGRSLDLLSVGVVACGLSTRSSFGAVGHVRIIVFNFVVNLIDVSRIGVT